MTIHVTITHEGGPELKDPVQLHRVYEDGTAPQFLEELQPKESAVHAVWEGSGILVTEILEDVYTTTKS